MNNSGYNSEFSLAAKQPENFIRIDRNSMQSDSARPGQTIANSPSLCLRYEIQRNI